MHFKVKNNPERSSFFFFSLYRTLGRMLSVNQPLNPAACKHPRKDFIVHVLFLLLLTWRVWMKTQAGASSAYSARLCE